MSPDMPYLLNERGELVQWLGRDVAEDDVLTHVAQVLLVAVQLNVARLAKKMVDFKDKFLCEDHLNLMVYSYTSKPCLARANDIPCLI